ncbi:transcriptional regulator, IclR family [Albimonas donghaensis]|uniref:Transcriptional regulator, IclR family n=1 Tax=Albimonas donghaensis TaxID=356660 RepID=A0A1H3DME7_9RHOB|nr:IclR family transcriptional regulator [Albimonas donghaensis]SDX67248.1 transcriptional regulator, IclR family [Albimonas donghaensis]
MTSRPRSTISAPPPPDPAPPVSAGQPRRFPEIDERLLLQSVSRALDVIEAYAAAPRPMSLGEIAEASGINKSAAQRIGQTLLSRGYLEQTEHGRLKLGRQFLDRSFDYLRSNALIERATPVLIDLRKTTEERVDLSLFDADSDNLSIVYAARMQSKRETFYATLPGRRQPTFASSGGRACLALMSDAEIEDVLDRTRFEPLTPRTEIDRARVREGIEAARRAGYALMLEQALLGEIVLAAAIRDRAGRPVGAIHIAGSLSEWTEEAFSRRFAPLAMSAAASLSG